MMYPHGLLMTILLCVLTVAAAAASGSASASGSTALDPCDAHAHATAADALECRSLSMAEMQIMGLTPIQIFCKCSRVCPAPSAFNLLPTCSTHAHHGLYSEFTHALTSRGTSMQWSIFFLAMMLLLGAGFRMSFPRWLPYTVGILIFGMLTGAVAQLLVAQSSCPWQAFAYAGSDHLVSRAEWALYQCDGCREDSFCGADGDGAAPQIGTRFTRRYTGAKTFDDLDAKFKLSSMHPEFIDSVGGDGQLSADELWTEECNLVRDMVSLSDIDPHALLVIFLPALLFESAAFGVDLGIFRKQLPQILWLAGPAMVLSSLVSGGLIQGLSAAAHGASNAWPFMVCLLVGTICSATDPVAVVSLLKELGAAKTLGTLIEGESLLNDGSAVVLFIWIKNAIGYARGVEAPGWSSGVDLIRVVSQMAIFGVALGLLAGKTTVASLRFVYNDVLVEVSVLIASAYLTFWLGEVVLASSSVLAVVVQGLYINMHKGSISPEVLHFAHQLFEIIAHVRSSPPRVSPSCNPTVATSGPCLAPSPTLLCILPTASCYPFLYLPIQISGAGPQHNHLCHRWHQARAGARRQPRHPRRLLPGAHWFGLSGGDDRPRRRPRRLLPPPAQDRHGLLGPGSHCHVVGGAAGRRGTGPRPGHPSHRLRWADVGQRWP